MTPPLISVVLLSFDRPQLLPAALASLLAQTYPNLELLVVDNQSPQSPRIVEIVKTHPAIKLIESGGNLGFTGGMNLGLAHATGDYVYLTEDDVYLAPDCIQRLVEYAEANPRAGLVTGVLLNGETQRILCAGAMLSLSPRYEKTLLHYQAPPDVAGTAPYPVTYVIGCMILARRELLVSLGGFRPYFFMYYDDDDLSVRVTRRGYISAVVPSARAVHEEPKFNPGYWNDLVEFHRYKNGVCLSIIHGPARAIPGLLFKALFRVGLGALRRGQFRLTWLYARVTAWILVHLPRLLRDRRAEASAERQAR